MASSVPKRPGGPSLPKINPGGRGPATDEIAQKDVPASVAATRLTGGPNQQADAAKSALAMLLGGGPKKPGQKQAPPGFRDEDFEDEETWPILPVTTWRSPAMGAHYDVTDTCKWVLSTSELRKDYIARKHSNWWRSYMVQRPHHVVLDFGRPIRLTEANFALPGENSEAGLVS